MSPASGVCSSSLLQRSNAPETALPSLGQPAEALPSPARLLGGDLEPSGLEDSLCVGPHMSIYLLYYTSVTHRLKEGMFWLSSPHRREVQLSSSGPSSIKKAAEAGARVSQADFKSWGTTAAQLSPE